jgi:hypothetical protein
LTLSQSNSTPTGGRPRREKCARGHALTPDNLYVYGDERQCLTCKREQNREGMRRRRADPAYRQAENERHRKQYAERYASDPDFRVAETVRKREYRERKRMEAEHG